MTDIPTNTVSKSAETDAAANKAKQDGPDYWYGLIGEKVAGEFLQLTDRTMQAYRQRGGGPKFIRISSRCIRYRRFDLKAWTETRMRSSTSDVGEAA